MGVKLSIIIPYYNAKDYTEELLERLAPQITPDVEVVLVDDASPEPFATEYPWCKVVRHKTNKRCSGARNTGLTKSAGEYISFVDADDMVAEDFVKRILQEIDRAPFDVCDLSWKSLTAEGTQHDHRLQSRSDRLKNPSVCTRVFSRAYIGKNRFNTKKDSTEDEDFSRKLGYLDPDQKCTHTAITDYMYFYRTAVPESKIKRYKEGLMHTKRIAYYYHEVTADMTWLLDQIREEDKQNEVWLLTNRCDIPELKRYCQISKPMRIWAHELRGEAYQLCEVIHSPIKTQVVIYVSFCNAVGGITTFIYQWCVVMMRRYDIVVVYDKMPESHIARLREIVRVEKNRPEMKIKCDTLILNRLTDRIPDNIKAKQTIQICHACSQVKYRIPTDRDYLVNVSKAAKDSWGEESASGIIIHNPIVKSKDKALLLISATRVGARDKGGNDSRMKKLATMLTEAGIKYIWLNFSDTPLNWMPGNFINMDPEIDIQPYIAKADYLVQLSDVEAYSYSILEALINDTAVICTPFESAAESGVRDGKTGYIVPFDMDFDAKKLLDIPAFTFHHSNDMTIKKWKEIIGPPHPFRCYVPPKSAKVRVIKTYYDIALQRQMKPGMEADMPMNRIEKLRSMGLVI